MENRNPQLLSLPALAELLKLPESWIKTEADAGRIPHLKIGKRYRFNRESVESLLAQRAAHGGKATDDGSCWVTALALAVRDGDKPGADRACAELRRLGIDLTTAARLKRKAVRNAR